MLWRINFIWARTFQSFRIFAGTIQTYFVSCGKHLDQEKVEISIDWWPRTDCVINFDLVNPFFFYE